MLVGSPTPRPVIAQVHSIASTAVANDAVRAPLRADKKAVSVPTLEVPEKKLVSPAVPLVLDELNLRAEISKSQAAAQNTVQLWLKDHEGKVKRALKSRGIKQREDRAELTQNVFFSAYLALRRGDQVVNPAAWLRECARKHAGNYHNRVWQRRAQLEDDVREHREDPEQITSNRERVQRALAVLTEDQKKMVLDVRVDGVGWKDVAHERGITVEKARWVCACAEWQMLDALLRSEKAPFRGAAQARAPSRRGRKPRRDKNYGVKVSR